MSMLGLDLANRSVKVVSGTYQDCYVNRLQKIYGIENEQYSVDKTIYEYGGRKYALTGKGLSSGGRDSDRYFTEEYLVELLIAVTKSTVDTTVDIVLPLPCEDYKNKKLVAKIKEYLKGKYEIKINDRNRLVIINSIRVIAQPFGVLVHYLLDINGEFINDRHKYKYVVIDIGYGTTDIICTDGLRVEKIIGCNIGCLDIMNYFLDYINANHDIKVTRNDFSDNIINPVLKKYGDVFDFTKELQTAKSIVAGEIKTFINDSGIDLMLYDRIIYDGGGSILLQNELISKRNEKLYPNAQMANAKGAYLYGIIRNK